MVGASWDSDRCAALRQNEEVFWRASQWHKDKKTREKKRKKHDFPNLKFWHSSSYSVCPLTKLAAIFENIRLICIHVYFHTVDRKLRTEILNQLYSLVRLRLRFPSFLSNKYSAKKTEKAFSLNAIYKLNRLHVQNGLDCTLLEQLFTLVFKACALLWVISENYYILYFCQTDKQKKQVVPG